MNILSVLAPAILVLLAVACAAENPTPAPTPAPDLQTTPDLGATVEAAVAAALPTGTPTPTPDIDATVEARMSATLAAIPAPTSAPEATTAPTATTAPEATMTPQPTAVPTATPTVVPTATPTVVPTVVPTATPTVVPTAIPTATLQPTPEAITTKLGGKLTVAINHFDTEIMDPHIAGKNVGLYIFNHSQDYLMGIDVDNTLSNAWGWADSWEQVNGSTWDITLKQDIIDHDGVNITAEDGVWNVTRWASDEAAGGYNAVSGGWRNIFKDAEALDSHKFRINLLQDYAFVFNIIPPIGGADLYVFPKHSWVDNGGTPEGWAAAGYGGTGFTDMKVHTLGQSVRHHRFDGYYGDAEYHFKFREMEVILSAWDAPRLAQVATGQVDIANMSGPYVEEIRAAGLKVDGPKAVDVVYLGIYQTFDPGHCTNKLNVRRAMNLAVDAEAIRAGIWPPGIVTPAITAFTSPQDESWNPTLTPYGYDPDEAKRLLKEEGCAGFRFDAYAYDFAAGPEMADMTDAIVTYLVAAGIDARYTPINWAANSQKLRNLQFGSDDGPASGGAHWQLGGRNFGDKIRVHGLCGPQGGSVCNLPDPETWRHRYLEYASIMDKDRRVARAQEMSKELYDLYAGIPIAMRNAVWALDPHTICGDWKPIDGTPAHTMFNTLVPCETW